MALGNGNPKEGDKGSNFFWELKVLQGLEAIAVAIEAGGGGGGGGGGITALTGDVTAGPGTGSVIATIGALKVTTPKIANYAVTFGKMQQIPDYTFLGNSTFPIVGVGDVTALSLSNVPYFSGGISGTANNTTFLRGDGSWTTPASFTIQNYKSSLTARSFVNYQGSLNAIDEGAGTNTVTITGPTTADGITTNYNADNTAPIFKLASPLNGTEPTNLTATVSDVITDRYLNLNTNRLVITSTANLPTTGFAATAIISGGQLTGVTITNPGTGTGHIPNSVFSLAIVGGNPTVAATATIKTAAPISEVFITNGGSNYGAGTTVTFPAPSEPGGIQALGTPIIKNGVIVGVNITNPGSGYSSTTSPIVFTGSPGGSGAAGKYSLGKGIPFTVTITNPGSGYTSVPSLSISAGINDVDTAALTVTNGSSYTGSLFRVNGASTSKLSEIRNFANGIALSISSTFAGGTGINIQGNTSGNAINVTNAANGIAISNTTIGVNYASSATSTTGLLISNSNAGFSTPLNSFQLSGTPTGTTLIQNMLVLNRVNTTVNVLAPTVPNNSTDVSGVGTSVRWSNPFYNVPRPDPTAASFTGSITGNTLNVTAVASGSLSLSSTITFVGSLANTIITAFGSGSGGVGTYTIAVTYGTPVASTAMTASGTPYSPQQTSGNIIGLWRNADYSNALGGFDFDLAKAVSGIDPRRPTWPTSTIMRLRADGQVTFPQGLPTSSAGLVTGDLYTQTTAQLGIVGGGSQKVICIV